MTKESSKYILDISKEYAIYTCENRAIPQVSDGLKDAQRKALWLLRNKTSKIKTISLAGELISSNLYVHGDQSAAGAISMLAAPYVNNVPLVHGIGTFGTRVAPVDGIAAPRYTYVIKSKPADQFFYADMDIIPMKDNYDGSVKEPAQFLPLIPTVLLNGISGIAVGWSTDILPRRWKDILDATIKVVDGVKIHRIKPGYSFSNNEVVHLEDNSWEFSGKADTDGASSIIVTELTPDMSLEKFKDRLNKMEDAEQIIGYTDNSTDTINVVIKTKRGVVKGWSEQKCIDFLKLRQKKTERIVVIDWDGKAIRQYDKAENVVKDFVEWRLGFYKDRYQKLFDDATDELKFWKGVKLCFDKKLPSVLGTIATRQDIEKKVVTITKTLKLEDHHIDRIVNLSTYRWAKDYYAVVLEKIKTVEGDIKSHQSFLKSPKKRRDKYREELIALKKLKV